jgi:iron complex outermembrane receptor protein
MCRVNNNTNFSIFTMQKTSVFQPKTLVQLISVAMLSLAASPYSAAQTAAVPTDLGSIGATTAAGAYRPEEAAKGTASAIAPTQSSLKANQPQSIITREFMDLSVAPTAEYSRIVNIAPSLSGDSANGPGLSETKTTLRGFKDDQYNITFDGIPWGDTNNPAHHSTSFFPASTIGGAVVERGPGQASDLGYATFGGSINLFSKKPAAEQGFSVFTSQGTWNTQLYGVSFESGRMANFGDATLQLNYQRLKSDGYLSNSGVKSDNFTLKFEKPLGDASLLTVFTSFNKINYAQPDSNKGATLAQVALYGKNFQLNTDPTSMNFVGYNQTTKNTDFSYIRLRSELGNGWNLDNQLYTYAYDNQTKSATDPTFTGTGAVGGGIDPRRTATAGTWVLKGATLAPLNGNIPGIDKQNKYRVIGNIFKTTKELDKGLLRAGLWYENASTDRHQYDLDLTTGGYNRVEGTASNGSFLTGTNRPIDSVLFDQQSTIKNIQPFVEFEWKPTTDTTVTPGIKLANITRSHTSPVAQTTRTLNDSASLTYKSTLPFLTINQQIGSGLAVYGQYAKGMQIPDLNTFYVSNTANNSTEAQKSTNYQVGIVGKSDLMTWDAALYRIDFTNKLVSNNLTGTAAGFINIGGARYQGVETQMAYVLGGGFSAYANASINGAKASDTGQQIANAPDMTAALGSLYKSGPLDASLIYKVTGATRQKDFDATKAAINGLSYYDYYKVPAYGNLDLGVAYTIKNPTPWTKAVKLQFNVFNLLNSQATTAVSSGPYNKQIQYDTYVYQAPRSMQISLKTDF